MMIYSCKMPGPYHIENKLPCQDSFAVFRGESFSVLAVADGLGSELYSDIGSDVAVHTAVKFVSDHINEGMLFPEIRKIMNNALVNAYKAVLTRAAEDGNDAGEYDTTLCLAVYDGEHLYYAQSGDSGLVALLENGEYLRVTIQQRDEEGRVFPLCWGPEKWEFGSVDSPVSAFMLMTDGVFEQICPKLMRKHDIDINIPLARRFLDRFDCPEEDVPKLEKAAYTYLEHYSRKLLDDDKTVVVLVNPERKPEKKDESYYAIPDWKAMRDEAEKKLATADSYDSESADMISVKPQIAAEPTLDSFDDDADVSDDSPTETKGVQQDDAVVNADSSPEKKEETIVNPQENDKKPTISDISHKRVFNIIAVISLLLFGLFAWLAKDKIEQSMTVSALGVLIVCFLANASVLLPSSSIFIVVECSLLINPLLVALCGAAGAALGEMMGFCVGKYGKEAFPGRFRSWIEAKMESHRCLIILLFSALPLPVFDIIGMVSGATKMNALKFLGVCFAGKLIKMLCYVWLVQELMPLLK